MLIVAFMAVMVVLMVLVMVLMMVLLMVLVMGMSVNAAGDRGRGDARAGTGLEMLLSPKCQCTVMQIFCKWCGK